MILWFPCWPHLKAFMILICSACLILKLSHYINLAIIIIRKWTIVVFALQGPMTFNNQQRQRMTKRCTNCRPFVRAMGAALHVAFPLIQEWSCPHHKIIVQKKGRKWEVGCGPFTFQNGWPLVHAGKKGRLFQLEIKVISLSNNFQGTKGIFMLSGNVSGHTGVT